MVRPVLVAVGLEHVIFTLFSVSIELVLGILVALLLHQTLPGRGLLARAILIPWALPTIVACQDVALDAE